MKIFLGGDCRGSRGPGVQGSRVVGVERGVLVSADVLYPSTMDRIGMVDRSDSGPCCVINWYG